MCGIFGYIGEKNDASEIVLKGLKRLDYRGYDSWGIAVAEQKILIKKDIGKIGGITTIDLPPSHIAIAHTRWATTGAVTKQNAHPHLSSDGSFALAQNGIVENYAELKTQLSQKGYVFSTDTDTEVIVRLLEDKLKTADMKTAIRQTFKLLAGRNTIILITKDHKIYAARNGSPLVLGINGSDIYFSSDTLSFAQFADSMVIVENGQLVEANGSLSIFDIATGKKQDISPEPITISNQNIDKTGFEHFMLKEIFDTPLAISALVKQDSKPYSELAKAIKNADQVYTIGSGTAGIAAAQIAFYLRHIGGIKAINLVGADAQEYSNLLSKNDLILAPSQSGETADVLEVLEVAKKRGVKVASIVNMPGSMMTRVSDFKFMNDAGAEICVMSTKVFTSQICFGYLLAKTVEGKDQEGRVNLQELADSIQVYLSHPQNLQEIKKVAQHLSQKKDIFLLGKYQNFQIVREGMVKIIEGSYKHAHAIPAGDLKHYAITLIEKGVPVIIALSEDEVKSDILNAVNEVKTRGAEVIAVAVKPDPLFDFFLKVPDTGQTSAIMNVIPLQLLAYYLAEVLGNDIDKPRNIAKSVTVK